MTLLFGKDTSIEPIPNDLFPEHYFKFIEYNEVQQKADVNDALLTYYIGCIYRISDPIVTRDATRRLQLTAIHATHYYLNPHIPEVHHILNVYADFINPVATLEIQRQPCSSELEEQIRNCYSIESLLNVNPQHYQEVYKATTDQLDWVNPEGQQYPHNLLQPLPLIPDNRGRWTKAADYGHIKWIEDLVPREMWIQQPIDYNKHALWGVSHWGQKHKQFYGYAVNRESARDVYSKRRIIAVTELQIVEWHDYKHLDWISIYKLKKAILKGYASKTLKICCYSWSIVIKRRVEDLQLGVESYQKRLKLTKPDMYRPDLRRREAYTAHLNPRRFIYQNKDKKNRLMRIDKLHKFSDGTLNDVCNALDDRGSSLSLSSRLWNGTTTSIWIGFWRIIAVTELKIIEWHDYKHLDWILVCRDEDKIYKFKEGDLKRLRLQDIEDMLLLLEHCHQKASGRPSTGS
nr:nucleic acid-binding, OB-fold protein [Tanacetum cinerariifolium]